MGFPKIHSANRKGLSKTEANSPRVQKISLKPSIQFKKEDTYQTFNNQQATNSANAKIMPKIGGMKNHGSIIEGKKSKLSLPQLKQRLDDVQQLMGAVTAKNA